MDEDEFRKYMAALLLLAQGGQAFGHEPPKYSWHEDLHIERLNYSVRSTAESFLRNGMASTAVSSGSTTSAGGDSTST